MQGHPRAVVALRAICRQRIVADEGVAEEGFKQSGESRVRLRVS